MELFLQCKERFYNHNDLLRNMMGLLGNVAEVKELRPQLMTTEFVSEFLLLVDSTSDGIETSYNAAGVLVSSKYNPTYLLYSLKTKRFHQTRIVNYLCKTSAYVLRISTYLKLHSIFS